MFSIDGVVLTWEKLIVVGITVPVLLLLIWLVQRTRQGKAMRATAQDRDAAAMMAFVTGPAHAAAIAGVPTISRGGSLVTHFADDGSGANWAHAATVIGTVNGPTS